MRVQDDKDGRVGPVTPETYDRFDEYDCAPDTPDDKIDPALAAQIERDRRLFGPLKGQNRVTRA